MESGISVVICCYNSRDRIDETLRHLALQVVQKDLKWEVVLVDNNSTDGTVEQAASACQVLSAIRDFRVITESRQGLSYARKCGYLAAKYDLILFCDDDNWLQEEFVQRAYDFMKEHPAADIVGGWSEAISDVELPPWFDEFKAQFAVGEQGGVAGDITESRGYVWGAACVFRRKVLGSLEQCGFENLNTGRKGRGLSAGEDAELCFAARRLGYRIWYCPALRFTHYISSHRLSWGYLLKMFQGFGKSSVALDYLRDKRVDRRLEIRDCVRYLTRLSRLRYWVPFLNFNDTNMAWFMYFRGRLETLRHQRDYEDRWAAVQRLLISGKPP